MYAKKVMEFFKNPMHVGVIKNADAIGEVGNMKCGDIMKLYLKIKDDKISKVKFETFGCVAAIASTEALCRIIEGMKIEDALKVSKQDVIREMGGDVPSVKVHCSILAKEALEDAIKKYRKK